MGKPIVAIIGRQNVGKSTLLNRVAGKPLAIVEDLPGTTRDRIFASVSWQGVEFTLVDTGGFEPRPQSTMAQAVNEQVEVAMAEADAIVFLVDVKDGMLPADHEIADRLRRAKKPVLLAANKADNPQKEIAAAEFHQLGLGEPIAISAYHGRGISELLDRLISLLPPCAPVEAGPDIMKVAIVGRPGVGKSMLLNAILGEHRAIVSETPGTTRDAIDTLVDISGRSVILIDTAGIRRRGKVEVGVEKYSVLRALRAIERADVAILVLDAADPVTAQDLHVAGYIRQAAKGILLVVNKWDLVTNKKENEYNRYIMSRFKFAAYVSILYTSAKLGQGVDRVMPQAFEIYEERLKRIPAAEVNRVVQEAAAAHVLPRSGKKQLKILSAAQVAVNPPTFSLSVNDAKMMHFSYRRYLENKLREAFGFTGTPIILNFKTRGEQ